MEGWLVLHINFYMKNIADELNELVEQFTTNKPDRVEKLPQSGGDRVYFRIFAKDQTYIATYNTNVEENKTFIYCTNHFRSQGLPMPEILGVNEAQSIYLQQDLGTQSLLDKLEELGYTDEVYQLYQTTLQHLSQVQIMGHNGFDYDQCLTAKEFGKQAMLSDLLYFKYYFLDTLKLPYDKQALLNDFDTLSSYLDNSGDKYFMYRDFQSRNVMVKERSIFFIDYQGGMKGALQYDVASLLWQAKANLPQKWKEQLLDEYMDETEKNLLSVIDRPMFVSQYNGYVLIRLLQVLGAYGFRGLFERKAHFLSSIPLALKNLAFFLSNHKINVETPELNKMLTAIAASDIAERFETVKANEATPLVVSIFSFSYKQNIPVDNTGNGGGFLFDMRGIVNPGRFAEFKQLTGRDKEVKDFLEQKTQMGEFLNNAFNIVDISVEDYIKRDFASLLVGFGCTGGQHRSVYAADAMARHLKNKFGVKVEVHHMVQEAKNWVY